MVSRYVDLLSETDLNVLARVSGQGPADNAAGWFRSDPMRIAVALDDRATYAGLFETDAADPLETVSPLLVFAVVIHRGATEIGYHIHVPERHGSRLVIPVFDGERLARFVAAPATRLFLIELLGSYTRVLSGPRWEQSRGRWRRRRFSEMNPAQLAQLAASLPWEERTGAYRRLGDLALFLNGVFPDHAARQTLSPIDLDRILHSLPDHGQGQPLRLLQADRADATGPVLAALGPLWYRFAAKLVPVPSMSEQLTDLSEHFDQARRFLTFVTDRYLWNRRDRLFPAS
ncbi:MAG: hypothetical protein OEV40_25680 [Acidimicrobiia bacterium]|nr:hypothetical protein [Acidimicrobiia bacterium]